MSLLELKRKYCQLPNSLFNEAVEKVKEVNSLSDRELVEEAYKIEHEFGFNMECYMGIDVKYTVCDLGYCKRIEE